MKTDTQVQEDVLAELKWEPSANAAEIGVEVKDRVVTLAGHVGSFADSAWCTPGVRHVVDNINVAH